MTGASPPKVRSFLLSASGAGVYAAGVLFLDLVVAACLGTQVQAGIFYAAWLVPTIIIAIFSSGAIQGAFIPLYARKLTASNDLAVRSASALCVVVATLLTVTVAVMLLAGKISALVASGFTTEQQQGVALAIRILAPLLLAHGVASLLSGVLLHEHKQFQAAILPVLIPVTGAVAVLLWHPTATGLAAGSLLGCLLYMLVVWWTARRHLPAHALSPAWVRRSVAADFAREYWMAGLAHTALSALLLFSQSLAGHVSSQALATFVFGTRLVLLAQAFLATVIINVSLPAFARLAADGHYAEAWSVVKLLVRRALLLLVPAMLLWVLLSSQLVELLFMRGAFTQADVAPVAHIQRIFVLQLPLYVIGVIAWRMCNSMRWTPVLIMASFLALFVNVAAGLTLVPAYGAAGVAFAYVLGMMSWVACLYVMLRRNLLRSAALVTHSNEV